MRIASCPLAASPQTSKSASRLKISLSACRTKLLSSTIRTRLGWVVLGTLGRTEVAATSCSRGTPFLHGWGTNCDPLRLQLAVGKIARIDAKLFDTTDCICGRNESSLELQDRTPTKKI